MYHDQESADQAQEEFDRIFIKKEIPGDIPEYKFKGNKKEIGIIDLILEVKFSSSKSEARRLITQGGVSVNGERIDDLNQIVTLDEEKILKVGKRKFIKIVK